MGPARSRDPRHRYRERSPVLSRFRVCWGFWLFGGRLPDGRFVSTENYPDLEVGGSYTFLLRQIQGEWFLATGRPWVFQPRSDGTFEGSARALFSRSQLEEVCP